MPLKELTLKTTMLLCLLTGQRLQTLAAIDYENIVLLPDKCTIFVSKVLKTTKLGQYIKLLECPLYAKENLGVVRQLQGYSAMTNPLRASPTGKQLLISYQKPHNTVSTDTISGWIKTTLRHVFGAHSTREAATFAVPPQGTPLDNILWAADWKSASTFAWFYQRDVPPRPDTDFGTAVLQTIK